MFIFQYGYLDYEKCKYNTSDVFIEILLMKYVVCYSLCAKTNVSEKKVYVFASEHNKSLHSAFCFKIPIPLHPK